MIMLSIPFVVERVLSVEVRSLSWSRLQTETDRNIQVLRYFTGTDLQRLVSRKTHGFGLKSTNNSEKLDLHVDVHLFR